MEFVSERLNSAYKEFKDKYLFGYFGEGEPLDNGLPTCEYLLIQPYYSPTGDPHTLVLTPTLSLIQYLYDFTTLSWKALKYSVCDSLEDLDKKLLKQVHPPVWRE